MNNIIPNRLYLAPEKTSQTLIPDYTFSLNSSLPFSPFSPVSSPNFLTGLSRPVLSSITEAPKTKHLQAIIKIGSNTGSITITDLVNKYYVESDKFNLGEGLSESNNQGKLKTENTEYSLKTMERWAQIIKLYGINECHIVATESLRAASDGKEHLNQAKKILNEANPITVIKDRIIKPEEEAELSIETVKSQLGPNIQHGYVVDYGGASCEISKVMDSQLAKDDNKDGLFSSLKIGAHPLIAQLKELNSGLELWGKDLSALIPRLKGKITEQLDTLRFIDSEENGKSNKKNGNEENVRTLYLIGGSLRKAGESIMEKGETLNDIQLKRKTLLEKLEARQQNLLSVIKENHDQSEVKRLDHLKDLVSNLALMSLLEKMPKKIEIKFIENRMVDALISREAKEKGLDLSHLASQRPLGQIAVMDLATYGRGATLAKWLTDWIVKVLPDGELKGKEKSSISSAATYSYLYPSNTNTSEANRIKKSLEVELDNKENKGQILNILIPSMIGKDNVNISRTPESLFNKLTAQVLKLAKLISFNNPEILNYFRLSKNQADNEISLEHESSIPQGIDKLTNGGKVAQALGRINKIYKEISK